MPRWMERVTTLGMRPEQLIREVSLKFSLVEKLGEALGTTRQKKH